MTLRRLPATLGVLGLLLAAHPGIAQTASDDSSKTEKADGEKSDEKKPPKIKKLADWAKGKERIEGLFGFYRDPATGEVFMEVKPDQLGPEFIYFTYTLNGSSLDGLRRLGAVGDNYVFKLRRRYNQVDFIRQDTLYSYDKGSTLEGQKANILQPLLASAVIVAEDEADDRVVVKMKDVFQGKDLLRIGELSALGKLFGAEAGTLSKEKSNVRTIRNYPDNSEIVAEYVFDYPKANSAVGAVVAIQHTFVRMPKAGFTPRTEDPRVGFFTARNTNLSTLEDLPYNDKIYHWRLEKKDPKAAVSEVVKPVTYWIENTTPLEYRETIKAAALRWNAVFESLGYRNAVRVEVQPDDAKWDAGDVNHNMIRWVASPVPQYAGYGPTIVNPRTGEIVGADIVLEHATIQRWLRQDRLFGPQAGAPDAPAAHAGEDAAQHLLNCSAGKQLSEAIAMAQMALSLRTGLTQAQRDAAREEIVRQGLYYLVLHEVGHTLGLTHNMMGSFYKPIDALNRPDEKFGSNLANSVMDYPQVNLAPQGEQQGPYFPVSPGPYDYWALAYAYDEGLLDPAKRTEHLRRSTEPQFAFGNDADAMSITGLGMDPRVIPYDLSSQPVEYAVRQMDMIRKAEGELVDRVSSEGRSWDELRRAYELLLNMYRMNATVVSRYVGGVYVDRAFVGQPTKAAAPFVPVPIETQRRSMKLLNDYVFAPEALTLPDNLGAYLQFQRRGFDFFGRPQDPPVHAEVLAIQQGVLSHLLHPNTLQRMSNASLYGNRYSVNDMLSDLTGSIFDADLDGSINTFRQNLQTTYVERLAGMMRTGRPDSITKAAAFGQLTAIDKLMARSKSKGDDRTQVHRRYLRQLIKDALED